MNEIEF